MLLHPPAPWSLGCACGAPQGCIQLLERSGIPISGKNAVVVGRSNIVGMPAAMLLLGKDATVTIAHSRTKDPQELVKLADIVFAAAGKAEMVSTADIVFAPAGTASTVGNSDVVSAAAGKAERVRGLGREPQAAWHCMYCAVVLCLRSNRCIQQSSTASPQQHTTVLLRSCFHWSRRP